jgi:hypothetical protein
MSQTRHPRTQDWLTPVHMEEFARNGNPTPLGQAFAE